VNAIVATETVNVTHSVAATLPAIQATTPTTKIDDTQAWSAMQAKFLGNLWAPATQENIPVLQTNRLEMQLDRLQTLVKYGRATKDEQQEYLALKITFLSDRLDLLEYYHQRFETMTTEQSIHMIAKTDIKEGLAVEQQLRNEIFQLQSELQAI